VKWGGWGKKGPHGRSLRFLRPPSGLQEEAAAGPRRRGTRNGDSTRTGGSADAAGPSSESRKVGTEACHCALLARAFARPWAVKT